MILPTLHLNGTGSATLCAEYRELRLAIRQAHERLTQATCHGRDFYPQEPDAYTTALAERERMFKLLQEVYFYAAAWEEHADVRRSHIDLPTQPA